MFNVFLLSREFIYFRGICFVVLFCFCLSIYCFVVHLVFSLFALRFLFAFSPLTLSRYHTHTIHSHSYENILYTQAHKHTHLLILYRYHSSAFIFRFNSYCVCVFANSIQLDICIFNESNGMSNALGNILKLWALLMRNAEYGSNRCQDKWWKTASTTHKDETRKAPRFFFHSFAIVPSIMISKWNICTNLLPCI